jgi:PEP-CTERM motif
MNSMTRTSFALAVALAANQAFALSVTPNDSGTALASTIGGSGIAISNVTYNGATGASGTFTGGLASGIGIDTGIIMTSGKAVTAVGPNNSTGAGTNNGTPGSAALDALIPGFSTHDAATLSFDFTSAGGDLFFKYVFGSEEYNEFVGSSFNDVFAFFLDGVNIAIIPGSANIPVSINNLNCGNPFGTANNFCSLYNNNDTSAFNLQYDGFTDVLTASAIGLSAGTHTLSFAIADAGDSILDSGVFIQAGSVSDKPPDQPPGVPEPGTLGLALMGLLGLRMAKQRKSQ